MIATAHAPEPARFPDNESAGAGGFAEAPAAFDRDPPAAAEDALALPFIDVMRSTAVRQLLACDPAGAPIFAIDRDLFDRRRHAYLVAKAAMCDPERLDDETANLCDAAIEAAELLLLATPAALPFQAWVKFEILEEAILESLRDGERAAPRLLMALASFKHDLARFDFGDGERIYPRAV